MILYFAGQNKESSETFDHRINGKFHLTMFHPPGPDAMIKIAGQNKESSEAFDHRINGNFHLTTFHPPGPDAMIKIRTMHIFFAN